MRNIHPKTLQDLEFPTVLTQIASRCNTELGKEDALTIQPFRHKAELMEVLGQTSEYLASFSNDNRIPNHGFDHINNELGLLKIDNSTLETFVVVDCRRGLLDLDMHMLAGCPMHERLHSSTPSKAAALPPH